MRERSYRVDTSKLEALSTVYGSSTVARTVGVSKQLWHRYKRGQTDVPESKVQKICKEFKINKGELVLA